MAYALQLKNFLKPKTVENCSRFFTSVSSNGVIGQDNCQSKRMHLAVQRSYDLPEAGRLPLPPNIDSAETTRFSPMRNRDILSVNAVNVQQEMNNIDVTLNMQEPKEASISFNDPHLENYDPPTGVNLSSVMQSIVPEPFSASNQFEHFDHLNMPGGSWGQQTKYLSHELNSSHYTELRQDFRKTWSRYSDVD